MRLRALLLVAALILGSCAEPSRVREAALSVPRAAEAQLVQLTNALREDRGLPALRVGSRVRKRARAHSRRMAEQGRLFHSRLRRMFRGVKWRRAAENVGVGASATDIFLLLKASPDHLPNMLGNWSRTAVGIAAVPDGSLWVTQVFWRR